MAILRNPATGAVIATRVEPALTWFERTVGLIPRRNIEPDEGLWIERCSAIHTLGMRVSIDVIFVNAQGRVVRLCPGVPRSKLAVVCWAAHSVIELGSGALQKSALLLGDPLQLC